MSQEYEIHRKLMKIIDSGSPACFVTVTAVEGSAPQVAGAKMIVLEDGSILGTIGGGAIEHEVASEARELIKGGKPEMRSYNLEKDVHMKCGGHMTVFMEPVIPPAHLVIFGGGHIAKDLVPLAKKLAFRVTLFDDRAEYATQERHPEADEVIHCAYSEAPDKVKSDHNTYFVILTHGHKHDELVLNALIERDYAYLGMIGSKSKVGGVKNRLKERGVPEDKINTLKSPIGLPIKGNTPFEIAISISAELTLEKYSQ